jgi:DNA-3-methyladenine glycosylase II
MTRLIIPVDGEFSLAAAASFGFGPKPGRPEAGESLMRLAFAADDLAGYVGAVIRQEPGGTLIADVEGDASLASAEAQIRRVLSVDADPAGWFAAGQSDRVLGRIQSDHPGLRPVLFHSPYEAAAWSVLSQRRHRTQAAALSRRLSEAAGVTFELAGERQAAFPLPEQLLGLSEFKGIEEQRMARLHGVAQAALAGQLDPAALRAMPAGEAMAQLQRINGLGPVYAMLVYLRSTGVKDGLALGEPRLAGYLKHFYGLPATPDADQITRMAEPWRPFRTWACVLFRVGGDRADLPFEQPAGRRRYDARSAAGRNPAAGPAAAAEAGPAARR